MPRRRRVGHPGGVRRTLAQGLAPARRLRLPRPQAAAGAPLPRVRPGRPGPPVAGSAHATSLLPAMWAAGLHPTPSAGRRAHRQSTGGGLSRPAAEPGSTRPAASTAKLASRPRASSPFRTRSSASLTRTAPPPLSAQDSQHQPATPTSPTLRALALLASPHLASGPVPEPVRGGSRRHRPARCLAPGSRLPLNARALPGLRIPRQARLQLPIDTAASSRPWRTSRTRILA